MFHFGSLAVSGVEGFFDDKVAVWDFRKSAKWDKSFLLGVYSFRVLLKRFLEFSIGSRPRLPGNVLPALWE